MSHLLRTSILYTGLVALGTLVVGCSATKTQEYLARIDKGLAFGEKLVEVTKDEYERFCELAPGAKLCGDKNKPRITNALEHGPMLAGQIEALANKIGEVVIDLAPEHAETSTGTDVSSTSSASTSN